VAWVRISVLAVLLAVLVAAVSLARGGGPGEPVATKYGVTSQGRAFEVELDADGAPVAFDTELGAMCPTGRMVAMPWSSDSGDGVPFRRSGAKLRVAERGDTYELGLDATVARNGALRGTMTLVVHVRPRTRAPFDCVSPKVRFSAGR
jgi:hypothetical protein